MAFWKGIQRFGKIGRRFSTTEGIDLKIQFNEYLMKRPEVKGYINLPRS